MNLFFFILGFLFAIYVEKNLIYIDKFLYYIFKKLSNNGN